MSGILKSIGKVFKKIMKSPILKWVAIAVAVYFTAGLALGAMGVAFAATLPGIAGAASTLGITAGAFGAAATAGTALSAAGVAATSMEALLPAAEGSAALAAAGEGAAAVGAAEGAAAGGALIDAGTGVAALDAGAAAGAEAGTGLIDAATLGAGDAGASAVEPLTDAATGQVAGDAGADAVAQSTAIPGQSTASAVSPTTGTTPATPMTQGEAGIGPSGGGVDSPLGSVANQAAGGDSGILKWWNSQDALTKKMAYEGLSQSAKAVINAASQKANIDAIQKQRDRERDDIMRRGGVPDLTASYRPAGGYKTPGIINSGTGG